MSIEVTGVTGDIYRSLQTLLSTPAGTLVHDREYGVSWDSVDYPPPVAEAMHMAEVVEKVERYEPRAVVEDIVTETSEDGILKRRVVVSYANQEQSAG